MGLRAASRRQPKHKALPLFVPGALHLSPEHNLSVPWANLSVPRAQLVCPQDLTSSVPRSPACQLNGASLSVPWGHLNLSVPREDFPNLNLSVPRSPACHLNGLALFVCPRGQFVCPWELPRAQLVCPQSAFPGESSTCLSPGSFLEVPFAVPRKLPLPVPRPPEVVCPRKAPEVPVPGKPFSVMCGHARA
jgi:hypothetical protein